MPKRDKMAQTDITRHGSQFLCRFRTPHGECVHAVRPAPQASAAWPGWECNWNWRRERLDRTDRLTLRADTASRDALQTCRAMGSRSKRISRLCGTGWRTHPRLSGLHAAATARSFAPLPVAQQAPDCPGKRLAEVLGPSCPDGESRTLRSSATGLAAVCRHCRHANANGRGQAPAVCAACRFPAPMRGSGLLQNEAPKVTANARGSSTE